MNQIKFHIQLKKGQSGDWLAWIDQHAQFIEIAVNKYVHSDIEGFTLQCSGKLLSGAKTTSQLGYLHSEVLFKALLGYQAFGWNINNTEQAKYLLKKQIGFMEEIENPATGEIENVPASFAGATKEDVRLFIYQAIIFIETELNMKVESPEDYKLRLGIKKFTK